MSKSKPVKKVIVTSSRTENPPPSAKSKASTHSSFTGQAMIFTRTNFILMAVGFILIVIGMALMSGGAMPTPDVWDESIIYSARRTVLAPIVIVLGLVVEVYAIFKK